MALYGITNANQLIDTQTIDAACNQMIATAEAFINAADRVDYAKQDCGSNALSVDGKTMEESFDIVREGLKNVKKNIEEYAESLRQTANSILSAQVQELNNYNAQQAAAQQAANN